MRNAGRKPKPCRISKKLVSVLRIHASENRFAKPSSHLHLAFFPALSILGKLCASHRGA